MPHFPNFLSQFMSQTAADYKSDDPNPGSAVTLWGCKGTSEFLGQGFLLVFKSISKPTMHHLATIHECDQPTMSQQEINVN